MSHPKKKKHHYIPRFYLKRFSNDGLGKSIGLYNHITDIFVQEAPLKHQACENFLYGENDEIENGLAKMEDKMARLFYLWVDEKQFFPPPPETGAFKLLQQFILYQAFRIPKSGDNVTESMNKGLEPFLKEFQPDLWERVKGHRIVYKHPVLLILLQSIKHQHLLNFLDCRFLVNLSPLPFISSDAPVVFYNQLMEHAGNYIGSTGLASKGLQIFYPIHPRLMICLYDPTIYSFDNECINCCGTESIDEIHQLNGLQLINSKSQVFFDHTISKEYISELYSHFNEYREMEKSIHKIIRSGERRFFFSSSEDAHINLELSFFSFKVNPERYRGQLAPLRHPSLQRPSDE